MTFIMPLVLALFMGADERGVAPPELIPTPPKPLGKVRTDPFQERFIKDFEKHLDDAFLASNVPGAAVAIVIDGNVVFIKGMGVRQIGKEDSVDAHTAFRIASVSKGFASILTGLQVGQEKINWEDPVKKHVPQFRTNPEDLSNSVTIKHILSHASGFPYQAYSTLVEDGLRRDVMFRRLQSIKLSRKPGEIHSYQNVAYSLIEPVLENVAACDYQTLLFDQIFRPLNMQDASVTYDEMMATQNKAIPHARYRKRYVPVSISRSYYNVAAAGGINASISDMAEWMKALLGHRQDVVSSNVLDSVFSPVIRTRVRNSAFSRFDYPRKGHYGMGWRVVEYPNDTLIYHGGYANGFKSEVALDKNKNVAICILTNAPNRFANKLVANFFKKYKDHYPKTLDQNNSPYISLPVADRKQPLDPSFNTALPESAP